MTCRYVCLITIVAIVAIVTTVSVDTGAQELGGIYVEVLDQTGQPVTDLTPEDFNIKTGPPSLSVDDEQTRPVVAAQPGTIPMKVALLVDNADGMVQGNALNSLRSGLGAFLDTLPAQHEVGLFTIARVPQLRVDFTTDRAELKESVSTIFAEKGQGAVMFDGIQETWARRFEDDDAWPVIVMVLTDGPEMSGNMTQDEYNALVGELMSRGANVHIVLLLTRGADARAKLRPIQTDYATNLTQNTGGLFQGINLATGLPDALTTLATEIGAHFDDMSNRWRVVYERSDPPGERIALMVNRPAVNVRIFTHRRMEP